MIARRRPLARPRSRFSSAAPAAALLVALLAASPARAALDPPPRRDVEWLLEHLPEAAMDQRFATLPLAAGPLAAGRWQTAVETAWGDSAGDVASLSGPLLAVGAVRGLGARWGVEALAAFDQLGFGGSGGPETLHPLFLRDRPLDLPETAVFSDPRGTYRALSAGLAMVRQWPGAAGGRGWTLTAGVLAQRVELDGYALDYRLTGGRDAGAAGVLDHSAGYSFFSPFAALSRELPLGRRFTLRPRVVAAVPVPRRGFAGRLSGPGFDLTGDTADVGHGKHMGDPALTFGAELEHRRSGLALDLGVALSQPIAERVSHAGLDRSLLLAVSWHSRHRRAAR